MSENIPRMHYEPITTNRLTKTGKNPLQQLIHSIPYPQLLAYLQAYAEKHRAAVVLMNIEVAQTMLPSIMAMVLASVKTENNGG